MGEGQTEREQATEGGDRERPGAAEQDTSGFTGTSSARLGRRCGHGVRDAASMPTVNPSQSGGWRATPSGERMEGMNGSTEGGRTSGIAIRRSGRTA